MRCAEGNRVNKLLIKTLPAWLTKMHRLLTLICGATSEFPLHCSVADLPTATVVLAGSMGLNSGSVGWAWSVD